MINRFLFAFVTTQSGVMVNVLSLEPHVMQKPQTAMHISGRPFKDHALQAGYTIDISIRFSGLTFANDLSLPDIWEQFRQVGETRASCYSGRLLQGCFMQNYNTDG